MIERLTPAQYARQRWKNDGGETLEIAADAEATPPAWRISVATIERSGPFSDFSGYDRTIVSLDGGAVRLTIDGIDVVLARCEPLAFTGESKVHATLDGAPARDLNVMTQRASYAHDVEIVATPSVFLTDEDELVFAYVMRGEATVGGIACASGDTVYLDGEERVEIAPAGDAIVCVARITPR